MVSKRGLEIFIILVENGKDFEAIINRAIWIKTYFPTFKKKY